MGGPILEAANVTRWFRLPRTAVFQRPPRMHAVRDVSMVVNEGDTIGIVGESGSGKSTLAKLFMALDRPQEGVVRYQGREISFAKDSQLTAFRREVQIIFQDPNSSLDPRMRVGTSIIEPLRSLRVSGDHRAALDDLMHAVGLPASAVERYPHEFSGGQRQRIAIARALAPGPKLLIADEPVSALDVSVQAQILNLLADLREEFGLTLIIISHDLAVVHHVADRVAVMCAGRIVETGPTEDVFARPQHSYTKALLGSILTLDGKVPTGTVGEVV